MLLDIAILAVGFFILVKGADVFVDGSASLARVFRVPGLIIGLTIVALGTSAPELAVSTAAALQGSNEIALSNVLGSNMFNLLMVLGICSMFFPLPTSRGILSRDFPVSIGVTALVFVLAGLYKLFGTDLSSYEMTEDVSVLGRAGGIILLVLFVSYIFILISDAKKHPEPETDEEKKSLPKCFFLIVLGLLMVIGGGQAVVYSAKSIAAALGMTETLIGLTVVAVGTSLPELVTSIVAARKHETGLAVGNVVGSNIFNLMFILGVSTTIRPVAINFASFCDIIVLMGVSLVTFVFLATGKKINRAEGIVMVLLYCAQVVFAIVR